MAPKKVTSDMLLGENTPQDASASGGVFDKKKDDTTPTQVVDKDVTPSEDDKKKKDSSSAGKKGTTTSVSGSTSRDTQLTEITELSPSREHATMGSIGKRKDMARRGRAKKEAGGKKRATKQLTQFNKKLKHLRKTQAKKLKALKHPRSFSQNIMRILRSVNESQEADAFAHKRVNQLSMMIFDSFANDLCDRLCATGVELMKNTGKRQLGSNEIKAAMKLVLPHDMSTCAEEAVQVSLTSYRDSTRKFQGKIAKAGDNKKKAVAMKKDKD